MSDTVLQLALLAAAFLQISGKVTVSGRQLLVDGSAIHLKAVCWNPVPAGGTHPANLDFVGTVAADSALMAAAGINAVRTYEPITSTAVLDALWAHKIYVLMSVYNWGGAEASTVTDKVNAVKGHPAILLWQVGNEWNYNKLYMNSMTIEQSITRIREVATLIKQLDTDHPVATVYGEVPSSALISSMPEIDVWGLNAYRGISFGDLFTTWAARASLPMYIGEYGADSYNAGTSAEDQDAQARATTALTDEIVTNSVLKANGVCLGGAIFEFSDEWWKDTSGTNNVQDIGGIAPGGGPYPDNTFNEEWWGLVKMDRSLKKAYTAFKNVAMPENVAVLTTAAPTTAPTAGFCSYPMWTIPGVGTDTRCDDSSGCPKRVESRCNDIYGISGGESCTVTCANLPRGAVDPGSEVWQCTGDTVYTLTSAAVVCPTDATQAPSTVAPSTQAPSTQAPSTQAPNVDKVKITYTLANVDYAKVKSDEKMMSDIISAVQEGVLVGLPTSYTKSDIEVSLFAGSVVAVATVAPQAGSTATELHSSLNTAKQADMEKGVNDNTLKVANIGTALVAGKSLSDVTITSGAPVLPPKKAATTTTRSGQGVVTSTAIGASTLSLGMVSAVSSVIISSLMP